MKKKKSLYTIISFWLISFSIVVSAQSLQSTQEATKKEMKINWKANRGGVSEFQDVDFKDGNMIVTQKAVFKDKRENVQTAIIPLSKIDITRMKSYESIDPEGFYYLSLFTKNEEKVMNIVTTYGEGTEDNIVNTFYYPLYSRSIEQSQSIKEKIEHLVYLIGSDK